MRLNTVTWGIGDRVALLIHGMLGAATQYHQVGPALAERLRLSRVPSLVIRAEPSRYVSVERARELAELGFWVRSVPCAGHCVWYGYFDDFMGVLDEWVGAG